MKTALISISLFVSLYALGQASRSSNFALLIAFEKDIPVQSITVAYYVKNGNGFVHINYQLDTIANTIQIFGKNHRVVGVSFPTLVFTMQHTNTPCGIAGTALVEKTKVFYLLSGFRLESYSPQINTVLKFNKEDAAILVEQLADDNYVVTNATASSLMVDTRFNQRLFISDEIIKINNNDTSNKDAATYYATANQ
jgi:hypothetical protein